MEVVRMLNFIRQYKGSILITTLSIIFGSVVMGTAYMTVQEASFAPSKETKVNAANFSCTLSFPVHKVNAADNVSTSIGCIGLSAIPLSGNFPLTVTFFAYGQVQEEELVQSIFFFGDGEQGVVSEPGEQSSLIRRTTTHTYKTAGDYTAAVQFVSKNGAKSTTPKSCTTLIHVGP